MEVIQYGSSGKELESREADEEMQIPEKEDTS
jgi:hypothetical protein